MGKSSYDKDVVLCSREQAALLRSGQFSQLDIICRLDADFYCHCLTHLAEVRGLDFVVASSIPIPYFGDLASYLASPLRVLTAALNPSNGEFPDKTPRFDVGKGIKGPAELEAQLSAYFRCNPYSRWFRSFEPVLNGLGASYGGKMMKGEYASTALHVDMCSPIATSPTWSRLTSKTCSNPIL